MLRKYRVTWGRFTTAEQFTAEVVAPNPHEAIELVLDDGEFALLWEPKARSLGKAKCSAGFLRYVRGVAK